MTTAATVAAFIVLLTRSRVGMNIPSATAAAPAPVGLLFRISVVTS